MTDPLPEMERLQRETEELRCEKDETLRREVERLRREIEEVRREKEELRREKEELWREEKLQREKEELQREKEETLEREIEELRRENGKTTFDEYLRYCHQHFFRSLKLQDKSKSTDTDGGTTDVTDKCYPLWLRPWGDFIETQQRHYDIIGDILQDEHLLPSQSYIRTQGEDLSRKSVASQADLNLFQYPALEIPVMNIFDWLGPRSSTHPIGREFDCAEVSFETQPHSLTESYLGEEEDDEDEEIFGEDIQQRRGKGLDSWCFRTNHSGASKIAFPVEYKAAHKVRVEELRQALRREDLFTQVISRKSSGKFGTDEESQLQDQIEETVATALAQVFHYMVRLGTAYGCLTVGKSLIFLWVGDDDPRVLHHHMIEPERDAEGDDGLRVVPFYTAIAQVTTLCLRASRSPTRSDGWREDAMLLLKRWPQPYPEMESVTTDEEGSTESTRSTSSYVEPTPAVARRSSCRDAETIQKGDGDGDDDDGDDDDGDDNDDAAIDGDGLHRGRPMPSRATTQASNKRKAVSSGSESCKGPETSSGSEHEARQYCTQGCLLGLKRGHPLDENCPNISSHRASGDGSQHPISVTEFAPLVRAELGHRPHRHCEPLDAYGKYGARGALFRLTLARYGYTFVGKGTFAAAVRHLRREGRVYARLEQLQGEVVPVYLGNTDLERPYYLMAADIVHMLLMSWAGEEAATAGVADLKAETERSTRAVRSEGVLHNDLRPANILWNAERCRVMVIDFDRAIPFLPPKHPLLSRRSRKKRKWQKDTKF